MTFFSNTAERKSLSAVCMGSDLFFWILLWGYIGLCCHLQCKQVSVFTVAGWKYKNSVCLYLPASPQLSISQLSSRLFAYFQRLFPLLHLISCSFLPISRSVFCQHALWAHDLLRIRAHKHLVTLPTHAGTHTHSTMVLNAALKIKGNREILTKIHISSVSPITAYIVPVRLVLGIGSCNL